MAAKYKYENVKIISFVIGTVMYEDKVYWEQRAQGDSRMINA